MITFNAEDIKNYCGSKSFEKGRSCANHDDFIKTFIQDNAIYGVAIALLECLINNDTEAFIEILNAFLCVNKTQRIISTQLLSGNPTLKTIAKIVHETLAIGR